MSRSSIITQVSFRGRKPRHYAPIRFITLYTWNTGVRFSGNGVMPRWITTYNLHSRSFPWRTLSRGGHVTYC